VNEGQGIALGLLAAGAWGVTDVVASMLARRAGSLRATAWVQLVTLVVLVALLVGTGTPLPSEPWVVAASLFWGIVSAVAYVTFFTALRHGPLTVVSPTVSVYGGLSVVLAVLLLGESLRPVQALGTVIAVGGVLLVSIVVDRAAGRVRVVGPGVLYAVVSLVAFAAVTVGLSPVIGAAGWLPVLVLARIANTTAAWAMLGARRVVRARAARIAGAASGSAGAAAGISTGAPARVEAAHAQVEAAHGHGEPAHAHVVVAAPLGEVADPDDHEPGAHDPTTPGHAMVAASRARGVSRGARVAIALGLAAGLLDVTGFIAFAIGLEIAPTWLIGLTSSFGPVVAVAAGVLLFGERPRAIQWAGLGLVLVSIVLIGLG
jgi:drug/metabolite transporter (DMT)-like permease